MNAIRRVSEQLDHENWLIALAGCHLADDLGNPPSSGPLTQFEDFVRYGLIATEDTLRTLRRRNARSRDRMRKRIRRAPGIGRIFESHVRCLQHRLSVLQQRRNILLQLGDAIAWRVLLLDVRRIIPLYAPRTHELPGSVGLAGPLQLKANLERTGTMWAIENDLTRCCGHGDLTVVRLDRPDATPLLIEVKSHARGDLAEGSVVELLTLSAHTDLPVDKETHAMLLDAMGGVPHTDQMKVSARAERQAQEILSRTEFLASVIRTGAYQLRRPTKNHWNTIAEIIRKAATHGSAYDFPETGLAYFSVSLEGARQQADIARGRHQELIEDLSKQGPIQRASSTELSEVPELSAVVLPIALWGIDVELRAAVLAGRLGFSTFMAENRIAEEFERHQLGFSEEKGRWVIEDDDESYQLDEIEVRATQFAMAFSGLSPRSLVENIAQALRVERGRD